MSTAPKLRVVQVTDERDPLAVRALAIIRAAVMEVQSDRDLLAELEESRRGLRRSGAFHLLAAVAPDGAPVAAAAGMFLTTVNAGYVAYLAVEEQWRSARIGSRLRGKLVTEFRGDAQRMCGRDLSWVVGEVRQKNRWLQRLVRNGRAIPFDLSYFHPWLPRSREGTYVFYREPVADLRRTLPSSEVKQLLYALWRHAYRVPYPIQSETFRYMLDQLDARAEIGMGKA